MKLITEKFNVNQKKTYLYIYKNENSYSIFHTFLLFTQLSQWKCIYMSPQATPIQSKMQFRMDWGLEPRGFVSTRLTIKLDEMKLKTIYGNGDIQMI